MTSPGEPLVTSTAHTRLEDSLFCFYPHRPRVNEVSQTRLRDSSPSHDVSLLFFFSSRLPVALRRRQGREKRKASPQFAEEKHHSFHSFPSEVKLATAAISGRKQFFSFFLDFANELLGVRRRRRKKENVKKTKKKTAFANQ